MAAIFSRTDGAIRDDRAVTTLLAGGVGLLILGAWSIWLFTGEIAVYQSSTRARLEVSPAPTQLATRVPGRVVEAHLLVGERVAAGDLLLALDVTAVELAIKRARARLVAIEPELASVAREAAADSEAGIGGSTADQESEREVAARRRAAEVLVRQAEVEETRTRAMVDAGVQPTGDLSRAIAETQQRRAARDALAHEGSARNADRRQREANRDVRREQLNRQRAELEVELATVRGDLDQLTHDLERHTVRAPLAGVLGEVAVLRPGSMVADGAAVATIVPDGTLQVVAEYGAASIGRIVAGQRARVRLDGFPWTHFGMLDAKVARGGNELRDGAIRVELTVESVTSGEQKKTMPLVHGMTGGVEIEV
ncbi:MAG: HlyD family efflux transporter periplasmic adaptor subunit, partial [Opitutaceae bacterium]|nr:HlyD family efflux transporter periplasmic adaptor subunit [Opitutaceae bacterium]